MCLCPQVHIHRDTSHHKKKQNNDIWSSTSKKQGRLKMNSDRFGDTPVGGGPADGKHMTFKGMCNIK